jgi:hypothetical protein
MRIVKRIAVAVVVLVVAFVLVGLVLPGRYHVERSAVVAASPAAVFPLVDDLRAWPKWGVWFRRDPAMQVSYSPATTGVGAWSDWKSKTQGNGRMTVTSVRSPSLFEYRIEFPDMGMAANGTVALEPAGGGTRVTMGMDGGLGNNPVNRWFGLFMGRMVGPDFDAGLANLKAISEAPRS